jgi:hypothetical protein
VRLPDVEDWIDLYQQRFPRTRPNGRRTLTTLHDLLRDPPAGGFTVRDVAARAGVGLDTVARVVLHLRWLGVLSVDGGGWVAEPGGRPGHGLRYRYVTHWPPRDGSLPLPGPRGEGEAADSPGLRSAGSSGGPGGESRYSGRRRIMRRR